MHITGRKDTLQKKQKLALRHAAMKTITAIGITDK